MAAYAPLSHYVCSCIASMGVKTRAKKFCFRGRVMGLLMPLGSGPNDLQTWNPKITPPKTQRICDSLVKQRVGGVNILNPLQPSGSPKR